MTCHWAVKLSPYTARCMKHHINSVSPHWPLLILSRCVQASLRLNMSCSFSNPVLLNCNTNGREAFYDAQLNTYPLLTWMQTLCENLIMTKLGENCTAHGSMWVNTNISLTVLWRLQLFLRSLGQKITYMRKSLFVYLLPSRTCSFVIPSV